MVKTYFYTISPVYLDRKETPFDSDIHALQNQVGGLFEHFILSENLNQYHIDSWINDEGKLDNLEPLAILCDVNDGSIIDYIAGPICFTKYDDDGTTYGLTKDDIKRIDKWLDKLPKVPFAWGDTFYPVFRIDGFIKPW